MLIGCRQHVRRHARQGRRLAARRRRRDREDADRQDGHSSEERTHGILLGKYVGRAGHWPLPTVTLNNENHCPSNPTHFTERQLLNPRRACCKAGVPFRWPAAPSVAWPSNPSARSV